MADKITLEDFRAFADQRFLEGLAAPDRLREKMSEIFGFAIANESLMDSEANAYFDKMLDSLATLYESGLAGAPDSPHKRKMLRLIGLTRRKHHQAERFLIGLGRPLVTPFAVAEEGKPIFVETLQSVLDLLFDVTRKPQTGLAGFGTLSMFYWTIDELTVAFYLAERKYATQAYSHLRTVIDLLDKAELFFKLPEWAGVWASDEKKKILRELSPGAVRIKLGKPKFDAVYDFLTDRGMHGTINAVKKRVVQRRNKIGERRHVAMWIGGVAWDEEVDIAISFCIFSTLLVLTGVAETFRSRLNPEEVSSIIQSCLVKAKDFLRFHLIKPLELSGEDMSGIIAVVSKLTNKS